MDEKDFAILTHLFEDARLPFDALGKRVGLSGNAVKARIVRMEKEGVLKGFVACPSPALFGMRLSVLLFPSLENLDLRKEKILEEVSKIPHLRTLDLGVDRSVMAHVLHRDDVELEEISSQLERVLGKPPRRVLECPGHLPPPDRFPRLGLLDWKILRSLRSDGRKLLKDISRETGASYKTVKKRLEILLESQIVEITPHISTSEASGIVLFHLIVFLDSPRRRHEVLSSLEKPYAAIVLEDPPGIHLTLYRPTLEKAEEVRSFVESLPGVTRSILKITTRIRLDSWVDREIERRIEELEGQRRALLSPPPSLKVASDPSPPG